MNHRPALLWLNSKFGAAYKYPDSTQLNSDKNICSHQSRSLGFEYTIHQKSIVVETCQDFPGQLTVRPSPLAVFEGPTSPRRIREEGEKREGKGENTPNINLWLWLWWYGGSSNALFFVVVCGHLWPSFFWCWQVNSSGKEDGTDARTGVRSHDQVN